MTLTPAAAAQIAALSGGDPAKGLRLYVEKGGCSGLQYGMAIGAPQPGDDLVEQDCARLYIDRESLAFLAGCTLDYEDGLTGAGFRVINPHAKRHCGCGTSFEP